MPVLVKVVVVPDVLGLGLGVVATGDVVARGFVLMQLDLKLVAEKMRKLVDLFVFLHAFTSHLFYSVVSAMLTISTVDLRDLRQLEDNSFILEL